MLQLAIFDAPNASLIVDVSSRANEVQISTNAHGFAALTVNVDLTLVAAFQLYDRPGLPHVVLTDGTIVVFEGRLEDVAIIDLGTRLTAFGYWRALSDAPYTSLWSDTSVAAWRPLTTADRSDARTEKWTTDTNNRLFIAPNKGEAYTTTTPGWLGYAAPHRGTRNIARVTFSYELLASGDYRGRLIGVDTSFAGTPTTEWSLTGNSGSQTGTATITISGANTQYLYFQLEALSGVTYTGETGDWYLKITNIRMMTTTASAVTVDAIATALASYVNGINSSQLATDMTLIAAPGLDLTDEVYEDDFPADILTRLVGLGDDQTPPRQWEVGIWEGRRLHLRVRGATGRAWYVDAGSLDVERSLATLNNAAYAVYQDPNNQVQRTTTATDAGSISRFGLTRRAAVPASTTSNTQAGVQRDAYLDDRKLPPTRAGIQIPALYDGAGGRWPLWMARSGDTITIRNLPPTLSLDVDRIRTFRIAETAYSCDTDVLQVTPELPPPSLEVMLARQGSGLAR